MNKITAVILVIILAAVPLLSLAIEGKESSFVLDVSGGMDTVPAQTEQLLNKSIPGKIFLERIKHRLLVLGGAEEFGGVFLHEGNLINNYRPDAENGITGNLQNVIDFIEQKQMPSYLMMIPTECVVCQEEVPELADIFNQKTMIDTMYSAFSGNAITVDAYGALFRNREKDVYYNTHALPTSLGGYYLYSELIERLGRSPHDIDEFDISYAGYGFYGSDYDKMPLEGVKSDAVSLYYYNSYNRSYTVTHFKEGQTYTYDRLYIAEYESAEDKTDIIFGGLSPIVTVDTMGPYTDELLIFGDETAKCYVPFLVNHYARITIVSLDKLTPSLAKNIDTERYRQVLFAYSVDTFAKMGSLDNIKMLFEE